MSVIEPDAAAHRARRQDAGQHRPVGPDGEGGGTQNSRANT